MRLVPNNINTNTIREYAYSLNCFDFLNQLLIPIFTQLGYNYLKEDKEQMYNLLSENKIVFFKDNPILNFREYILVLFYVNEMDKNFYYESKVSQNITKYFDNLFVDESIGTKFFPNYIFLITSKNIQEEFPKLLFENLKDFYRYNIRLFDINYLIKLIYKINFLIEPIKNKLYLKDDEEAQNKKVSSSINNQAVQENTQEEVKNKGEDNKHIEYLKQILNSKDIIKIDDLFKTFLPFNIENLSTEESEYVFDFLLKMIKLNISNSKSLLWAVKNLYIYQKFIPAKMINRCLNIILKLYFYSKTSYECENYFVKLINNFDLDYISANLDTIIKASFDHYYDNEKSILIRELYNKLLKADFIDHQSKEYEYITQYLKNKNINIYEEYSTVLS